MCSAVAFENSHGGVGSLLVDGRNVDPSKEVSAHAVDPGHEVELSGVMKQFTGLIWDKVPVDHRRELNEIHNRTFRREASPSGFTHFRRRSHVVPYVASVTMQ